MRLVSSVSAMLLVVGFGQLTLADDLPAFDRWFVDATLRVDYLQGGDASEEFVTLDRVYRQGIWAGSRTHRIDPFEVGRTLVELREPGSNELLFSRRLDSYFGEYRTTDQAGKGGQAGLSCDGSGAVPESEGQAPHQDSPEG